MWLKWESVLSILAQPCIPTKHSCLFLVYLCCDPRLQEKSSSCQVGLSWSSFGSKNWDCCAYWLSCLILEPKSIPSVIAPALSGFSQYCRAVSKENRSFLSLLANIFGCSCQGCSLHLKVSKQGNEVPVRKFWKQWNIHSLLRERTSHGGSEISFIWAFYMLP